MFLQHARRTFALSALLLIISAVALLSALGCAFVSRLQSDYPLPHLEVLFPTHYCAEATFQSCFLKSESVSTHSTVAAMQESIRKC